MKFPGFSGDAFFAAGELLRIARGSPAELTVPTRRIIEGVDVIGDVGCSGLL